MTRTNRILPVLALAIAAAVSMPAMARDHGRRDHDDRDDRRSEYRNDHRYDRRDGYDRHDDRRDDRRDDRYYDDRRHGRDRVVYVDPRYAPPPRVVYRNGPPPHAYPRWSRGARYDTRGYAPTYVVRDYGHYGLRQPPRGHYWRRDDRGDFILVAVATGLIASVIFR